MSFARLQKLVTYLLATLGLVALSFGGEIATPILIGVAVGVVLSWFAEAPLVERTWYVRGFTGLVVAVLALQVVRGFSGGGWLVLMMEFAAFLSVSRLFNRRSAADYQQIAVLAFMHLIAATVLTTGFGYAGVFVAFVVVTPWVLTFAQLRAEIERHYPKEPGADGATQAARVLASRRVVGPTFLAWTALLSLPMFAMTLVLFLLFPRVGLGFVSVGNARGQSVAGFGNKVELGGFGMIRTDPTVVLRLSPGPGVDPGRVSRYLRLRGTAFDHYDGRRWTRSEGQQVAMSSIDDYYPLQRMADRSRDLTFKIVLDRLDEPVLFLPTGTVGLRIPRRSLPGRAGRMRVTRAHGLDIRYSATDEPGIVYEAIVSSEDAELDVPVARDMDDERYLQMPEGHARVVALAKKLAEGLEDPAEIATRFLGHLRDGDRYAYSLNQREGRGYPLESFLFETRAGHCEYFATALAIMLRSVGIPARNVTGFSGGEYNPYGGYFAIRQADAHSWVEAQIPGRGWVTFDPTPPARNEIGPMRSLFEDLSKMMDAARSYWLTQIISYDLRSQIGILRNMREWTRGFSLPRFGETAASGPGVERAADKGKGFSVPWLGLVAPLVLALAVFFAWRGLKQRGRKKGGLRASAREAQALYRELERLLARRGAARPPHITPEAHARSLDERPLSPVVREVTQEVTQLYVEARYGASELDPARLRNARERLRELKRAA
jgi:transglutaminase-like putative cysteine protease